MTTDELLERVRARARQPALQTDYIRISPKILPPPATAEDIAAAETELGTALHPLHRRLLREVANGGFGPGDGLVGVRGGARDSHDWLLPQLAAMLSAGDEKTRMSAGCVPLCEWGDGIWSCVDAKTGAVIIIDEYGHG